PADDAPPTYPVHGAAPLRGPARPRRRHALLVVVGMGYQHQAPGPVGGERVGQGGVCGAGVGSSHATSITRTPPVSPGLADDHGRKLSPRRRRHPPKGPSCPHSSPTTAPPGRPTTTGSSAITPARSSPRR